MKLMIGAGSIRREGWMTLDARGGNFTATIPPLPDVVKAVKWEEIEWVHGITSLYPWEAQAILPELRNVLMSDGKLTLEQPNFREAVKRVEWLFGDPSHKEPLIMNRWSYTPEGLMDWLYIAGFKRVDILPARHHVPARDFRLEAYL